jgi:hypothetical protein
MFYPSFIILVEQTIVLVMRTGGEASCSPHRRLVVQNLVEDEILSVHVREYAALPGPCAPINGVGIDDEFGIDLVCEPTKSE